MTLHRWLQPLDVNGIPSKDSKRKLENADSNGGQKKPKSSCPKEKLILSDASKVYSKARVCESMRMNDFTPTEHLRLSYLDRARHLAEFQLQGIPYGLTTSKQGNNAWAFIGLDNGDVTVLSMERESMGQLVAEIPGLHDSAVRDLDTTSGSSALLSCSDVGVTLADLETNTVISSHKPGQEVGYHHCKFLPDTQQYFASTKGGSLYIMDTRTPTPTQTIRGSFHRSALHSAQTTCAVWYDSLTLATATNANEIVRYWDIRKTRSPVNEASPLPYRLEQDKTVEPRPTGVARGITSLTKVSEGNSEQLYALGRRGNVWSSTPWSQDSTGILVPETVDVPTYHSTIVSFTINRHNFLATSGSRGVSVLPTLDQRTLKMKMTSSASRLLEETASAATGLHWNESSRILLSTGDDQLCRFWAMP